MSRWKSRLGAKVDRVCRNWWKIASLCDVVWKLWELWNPVCCGWPLLLVCQQSISKWHVWCLLLRLTHTIVVLAKAAQLHIEMKQFLSTVMINFGLICSYDGSQLDSPLCKTTWLANMVSHLLVSVTYLLVEGNSLHNYHKAWQCALQCLWQVGSPLKSVWE